MMPGGGVEMKTNHGRGIAIAMVLSLSAIVAPLAAVAEESLNANDLEAAQLTAATEFGAFTIYAKGDKNVTVEVIDAARTAADGEVFNVRIELNGGGAVDYRSIHFTTAGKAEITIYLASSSKTDARILNSSMLRHRHGRARGTARRGRRHRASTVESRETPSSREQRDQHLPDRREIAG
jgi:Zn-dependent alcohol dehydrogenase